MSSDICKLPRERHPARVARCRVRKRQNAHFSKYDILQNSTSLPGLFLENSNANMYTIATTAKQVVPKVQSDMKTGRERSNQEDSKQFSEVVPGELEKGLLQIWLFTHRC